MNGSASPTTDELRVPEAPPIEGLRFRRYRDPADYDAVADVLRAGCFADGLDWLPDAAVIRAEFEHLDDFDVRQDLFIAEVDGRAVGFGYPQRSARDDLTLYGANGSVHPEWRRCGIGRAILRETERQARQMAERFEDAGGRVLASWVPDKASGSNELLTSEGYAAVRWYFTMIREGLDDSPDARLPEGLEIRAVRAEDVRPIFEADNEAFRDHWGHRETTDTDFERMLAMPDFDASLWSVAGDGDEVAGSVQTWIWKSENEGLGVRRGWLEHISVRRPWRRKGLATALIVDAFRRLQAAGMDDAILGVDADNPLGALQLYERLGFTVRDRSSAYRKAWEPGGRLV